MKALILAGGKGTRLRPITFSMAKQLVPVANKPVLFYGLEAIADAGIREVGMIVGDTAAEIERAVGDGARWGVRVTYIPQPEPLGLAHAVLTAEPYLQDEPFLMYLGDNLVTSSLQPLVQAFQQRQPNALILLAEVRKTATSARSRQSVTACAWSVARSNTASCWRAVAWRLWRRASRAVCWARMRWCGAGRVARALCA
jgi:dTDP-glucose pyrophosphorylase